MDNVCLLSSGADATARVSHLARADMQMNARAHGARRRLAGHLSRDACSLALTAVHVRQSRPISRVRDRVCY